MLFARGWPFSAAPAQSALYIEPCISQAYHVDFHDSFMGLWTTKSAAVLSRLNLTAVRVFLHHFEGFPIVSDPDPKLTAKPTLPLYEQLPVFLHDVILDSTTCECALSRHRPSPWPTTAALTGPATLPLTVVGSVSGSNPRKTTDYQRFRDRSRVLFGRDPNPFRGIFFTHPRNRLTPDDLPETTSPPSLSLWGSGRALGRGLPA